MTWIDKLFPKVPPLSAAQPRSAGAALSSTIRRTTNPPITQPTSPLTHAIGVLSAIEAERGYLVDRATLMSIPAFRKAVLLVAGITGTLPYYAYNADGHRVEHKLLSQPERLRGLTQSVSMTQLAQDMYLDGASLWFVDEIDSTKFPTAVRRVPFQDWEQDPGTGDIIMHGEKQPAAKVRLFVAPFEGLLSVAGPTVAMLRRLRALTALYAASPQAREYLAETEGLDLTDDEIETLLADWMAKRQSGVTAFLPSGLELKQVDQMSPEQLTLTAANLFEVEEVARLTGIDGFFLGVGSSAGFTYSNRVDIRQDLIDLYISPMLIRPIEQRLSVDDITPRGQTVRANLSYFLRANDLERMQAFAIGKPLGVYTTDEIRELENRPPLTPAQKAEIVTPPTGAAP